MEAKQLQLIPDEPIEGNLINFMLDNLPDDLHGDPPSAAMVRSVARLGILQPIGLIGEAVPSGWTTKAVAFGRRRIKAARLAGLVQIPALVFPTGWTPTAVLSLVENEQRGDNPVADFLAIEELMDGEHSMADIADATGLSLATVEARLRLRRLNPELKRAMIGGDIRFSVAEGASKLSKDLQLKLVSLLLDNGKLTQKDVIAVRRVAAADAADALPGDIFEVVSGGDTRPSASALAGELLERLPGDVPPTYLLAFKRLAAWLAKKEQGDMAPDAETQEAA